MEAKLQIFFGISTHHGRNPVGCFPSHVCPSEFADVHGADCIENGQNHDPYVGKNCEPHVYYAENAGYEACRLYAEGQNDVFPYNSEAFARYAYGLADIPGWHMNKKYWISVYFNRDVPDSLIKELVSSAHDIVLHKLPKKKQTEILQAD